VTQRAFLILKKMPIKPAPIKVSWQFFKKAKMTRRCFLC